VRETSSEGEGTTRERESIDARARGTRAGTRETARDGRAGMIGDFADRAAAPRGRARRETREEPTTTARAIDRTERMTDE